MNHATLASARLKRVLRVLRDGKPHSTWEVMRRAKVPAVSACMSELRALGAKIDCTRRNDGPHGAPRWYYTMTKGPKDDG